MKNKFFVGDKVILPPTQERGVVVHYWYESEIDEFDYYIAFFGTTFPEGKPDKIPYVLRYSEPGLEKAE